MDGNGDSGGGVIKAVGVLVRLTGVHKFYGGGLAGVHALNGIELALSAGELVSICGPSGSGKTSLLNVIAMLEPATEGSVVLANLLTGALTEQARADLRAEMIGMVFQGFTLVPVMTARENVMLPLLLRGQLATAALGAAHARADALLVQLGLANQADQYPHCLDASQSQRVAIARALIGKPRLVLADEPASRLDAACSHTMMDLFAREQQEHGTAFLLTTRDQRQLSRVSRTLQLVDGRILKTAEPSARKPFRAPA